VFWTSNFSLEDNFFFEKMLWGSRAIFFFETFRFTPRKTSRWKNSLVFQRLMFFLYQLVNLVLETCFIFSKTLKLSKTFSSWMSRFVLSFEQRALWFPYSRLSFGTIFKKKLVLEYLGCSQSQLWCPSWIFDTSLSERCSKYWLVKKIMTGHNWSV